MDGSAWKTLLGELGCLDNGRFVAPPGLKEVTIELGWTAGGYQIAVDHRKKKAEEWSYTEDFIIFTNDGLTGYHPWGHIDCVFTETA